MLGSEAEILAQPATKTKNKQPISGTWPLFPGHLCYWTLVEDLGPFSIHTLPLPLSPIPGFQQEHLTPSMNLREYKG